MYKLETYEANPDIILLPLLAQSLGVTTDELLTDKKAEKDDPKPKESQIFGVQGTVIKTPEEYEKASDFIAVDNNAKGIISIGLFSIGLVSSGLLSFDLFSLGILVIGLVSISAFAFGGVAFGAIAVGLVSFGAITIGFLSYGAVSVGYYVHTKKNCGYAMGRHIFFY